MRKPVIRVLAILLGVAVCGGLYRMVWGESRDYSNFTRIQNGMSVEEVRAILGAGVEVFQERIPTVVRVVNPADVDAKRRVGRPTSARGDYPTQDKPLVEGDYILQWENARTRERILVAFKNGKVCEKDYWNPNYL